MSNHARRGRASKRKPVERYNAHELHALAGAREDVAARGREVVAEWTYERRAWRWAEAWALAHDIRHGRTAA